MIHLKCLDKSNYYLNVGDKCLNNSQKCPGVSEQKHKLIFSKDTNLRLMYSVCDKWCCPEWLTSAIDDEVNSSSQSK